MSSLADLSRRRRRRKVEGDTSLRPGEKPSLASIEVGCRKFRRQTSAPPSDSAVLVLLVQASVVLHVMCYPIPVFLDRSESRGEFWEDASERKGWKGKERRESDGPREQETDDGRTSVMGYRLVEAMHRE